MAKRYQIWDKKSDIYTPSGAKFTAEQWMEKYPWVKIPQAKMVITTGIINGGCAMELGATKEHYRRMGAEIADDMTDEQALDAIEAFEDCPPSTGESTPEERIAAALELQNVMAMPTVNDDDPDME